MLSPAESETKTAAQSYSRIAFVASDAEEAVQACAELKARYDHVPAEEAEVVVALGGDGMMLQSLHAHLGKRTPIYGMNRGSVGFLMNEYNADDLLERLAAAEKNIIHPLKMTAIDGEGQEHAALAINEVSLFRQTFQASKLKITIDGKKRMDELICDGILVATPAGSTAYNLSAHGPILPIAAPLLALTPISPFRPRRWRGALLPNAAQVSIDVLEADKRPVSAVADHTEVRNVSRVDIVEASDIDLVMLFDPGHALDERILTEQFFY